MKAKFLFIGENPSKKALKMKVSWVDGRLAAIPLFAAIKALGLEPLDQHFTNIFKNDGITIQPKTITLARKSTLTVVALGLKVASVLKDYQITHIRITHPAARGKIRKRERYIAHVLMALTVKRKGVAGAK